MKKTILALCSVFIGISICTAQKIEMEKHFAGYDFYQNGESIKMKQLMKIVENNTSSYELIRKARTEKTFAWILGNSGSALVGFSIGNALGGGNDSWTIAGIGAGLIGVAVPLAISGNKKAKKGVEAYNSSLDTTSQYNFKPTYTLKTNAYGIGLVIRF